MNMRRWLTGLAGAIAMLAAGCGGGGGIGGTGAPMGTMRVSVTDAPACGYDEVNITVEKVRVHRSASASPDEPTGWSEIVLNPARRIDLLTLTNGALEELGEIELPAGTYQQIRLVLADNAGTSPPANSVVLSGSGDEIALTTPSAQQSGLKLNADVEVPAGKVLDVVLDFDACRSVVKRGNSGRYNLKPVISVIPVLSDAGLRVVGYVDPALVGPDTAVSVQTAASGVPPTLVKATIPDSTGRFVLRPVPEGNYTLVLTSPTHATAVMTGVPVTAAAPTTVSTQQFPLAPAAAASAPVTVSGSVQPVDATVRVLQSLTGGPTVEIGFVPVDGDTGGFVTALGLAAPLRTAYPAPANAPITFTADPGAAGLYTLEAVSGGVAQAAEVDVNVAPVPPVTFVFP
ncbi:DUF4382 domain-containing protein [Piscinibacter defluvii]|uniref:DUF4382 domain-containing protein n=1 Tax=Piscinibacter defluvii TaxID=1796922 RepID=UPI000FDD4738|nr:DUF4382 domain-containing protein [Piscinibacter defluvii]